MNLFHCGFHFSCYFPHTYHFSYSLHCRFHFSLYFHWGFHLISHFHVHHRLHFRSYFNFPNTPISKGIKFISLFSPFSLFLSLSPPPLSLSLPLPPPTHTHTHGCAKKVGVADFGVFFVIPLGIPSNLHGHLPGWKFDRKVLHSWKFWIFRGPGPGRLIGRYSRPIPYIGHNFRYSMSCGLKICR